MALTFKNFRNSFGAAAISMSAALSTPAFAQSVDEKVPHVTAPVATLASATNTSLRTTANNAANTNSMTSEDLPHAISNKTYASIAKNGYRPDVGYTHLEITEYFPDDKNPDAVMDAEAMRFPDAIVILNWEFSDGAGSRRQSEILDKMLPVLAKRCEREIVRIDIPVELYGRSYTTDAPRVFNSPEKTEYIVDDNYYIPLASISMPKDIDFKGKTIRANTLVAYASYDKSTNSSDKEQINRFYGALDTVIRQSNLDLANEKKEDALAIAREPN